MSAATAQTEIAYEWRVQYYIDEFGVEVVEQISREKFGIPASQLDKRQCDLFYFTLRDKELAERRPQPCITCGQMTERIECLPCHEGMQPAEYAAYEKRLAWKGWA